MVAEYVPNTGDVAWITLDPREGHEQAGRRPFLILTPKFYNAKTSLAVGCPITSVVKGYPFEVPLVGSTLSGVVLADQVKSVDWRVRRAEFQERLGPQTIKRIRLLLKQLLTIP